MILSMDIETECAVSGCDDSQCIHALLPHTARITCVGLYAQNFQPRVFRDLSALRTYLTANPQFEFIGHNFKFDLRMLRFHGVTIPLEQWVGDTCLMATASYIKIPDEWLELYDRERQAINKKLRGTGFAHREARHHSLKTLAPYFLKVPKFWEKHDKDDDEYVLKDCEYTYHLYKYFQQELELQQSKKFYSTKLLPWAKMYLEAEERGVKLDMELVERGAQESEAAALEVKKKLDSIWAPAYAAFRKMETDAIERNLVEKLAEIETRDKTRKQRDNWQAKAIESAKKQIAELPTEVNLASPTQLRWLLKTHLGLDITTLDGRESTDAEVLERLANEGREDVALLLKYREYQKLATTYYPSYKELSHNGVLHGTFNLDIARTGRTSSSNPNLQNQPAALHKLFVARPGYKMVTLDLSAIEPCVVAYYTEDAALCKLMIEGGDFHGVNAKALFNLDCDPNEVKAKHKNLRDIAKTCGLAVLYGAGANRLNMTLQLAGIRWTQEACQNAVKRLRAAYPDISKFKQALDKQAESLVPMKNLFGRFRLFPNKDDIYMKNFNGLAQGSASDLLVNSAHKAIQEFRRMELDGHLLMTIHDELVFEVPTARAEEAKQILIECMTNYKLETKWGLIPLRVEGAISDCWSK